jgi:hypothetical protein
MSGTLTVLLVAAMLATLGVLATGIVSMIRGGEFNQRHGNRLMRWRVICQAVAIGIFGLLLLVGHG